MIDSITGFDLKKVEELVQTALLVDQAANDETVVDKIVKEAESKIEGGHYKDALQILQDAWTYE